MPELVIAATDVAVAKKGFAGIIGEAATTADLVYYSKDNEQWWKTSADVDAGNVAYGLIVSGGGVADQQVVIYGKAGDAITLGNVLTQGRVYVMASTPGKIAEVEDLSPPTNEVQTVSVSGATSGTFTLTFDGQTTAALAYNATAADVEIALEALSNIDAVSVSGGPLNSSGVAVTFEGANAATDVALMTVTNSTDGTVDVTETTAGYSGDFLFIVGHAKSSTELELILKHTGDLVA